MDVATRAQNPRLGIALLCTGVAFFGMGEACVKILSKDYEILQVVWARYVFHALVFLLIFSRTASSARCGPRGRSCISRAR